MNKKYYEKIIKRNNAYLNKIQSLDEEKIIIGINIDNYNLYDDKTSIIKFQMMSESKIIDKTFLTKYHVNLEAINKKYYNKEKLTRTEKVLLMLKKKEREELKKISRGDELMEKMYEELCKMSEDKNSILSYSKEELDLEAEKIEAAEKAEKRGLEKGSYNEKINIAKNMIKMDMQIEDISKATGLSIQEIEKLKK